MPEIACPTCGRPFSLPEGVTVVECPGCGDALLIEGEKVERAEGTLPPVMWYYADAGGEQVGPVTEQRAIHLVQRGVIRRDTLVWHAHMPDWQAMERTRLASVAAAYLGTGTSGAYPLRQLPQGLAVGGMVTGIIGLVFSVIPCIFWLAALPLDIVGMVLSGMALQQVKAGKATGRGMALAGFICSIIGVALFVVYLLVFGFALRSGATSYSF